MGGQKNSEHVAPGRRAEPVSRAGAGVRTGHRTGAAGALPEGAGCGAGSAAEPAAGGSRVSVPSPARYRHLTRTDSDQPPDLIHGLLRGWGVKEVEKYTSVIQVR